MAKKVNLTSGQISDLNQFYLQKTDEELAAIIGVDVKTVQSEIKRNGLKRGKYTKKKLKGVIDESPLKNIDVDSEEVHESVSKNHS